MTDSDWLAQQFEHNRGHLRGVAYRMLGSLGEAEDAVQECWLRLSRSRAGEIDNLRAWLTTVVAHICLDMLRSRQSRREQPLPEPSDPPLAAPAARSTAPDPEAEAILADSVGYATLVVLNRLNPAERVAFVLHDLFDISFDEIAAVTGRSPDAARQLASRARRRVRGATALPESELAQQCSLVEKFLEALRRGDPALALEALDPAFAVRADAAATQLGGMAEVHGAEAWLKQAIRAAHGARLARVALVEGSVGLIVAPRGQLFVALRFTFTHGRIAALEVVADPERLRMLDVGVLDGGSSTV